MIKMKMKIVFLTLILNMINYFNFKLLKVVQITRHGARTPLHIKPNNFLQEELGQLTVVGFNQHVLLGKWNRKRYIENNHPDYIHFLPNDFDNNLIKIISSRFQRTQFSAIGNISGMYPGNTFKIHSDNKFEFTTYAKPPLDDNYINELIKEEKIISLDIMDKKRDYLFSTENCYIKYEKKFSTLNFVKSNLNKTIKRELYEMVTRFFNKENLAKNNFNTNYLNIEEKSMIKQQLQSKFESIFNDKDLEEMTLKDFVKINDYLNFFEFSFKNPKTVYDLKPVEEILKKITLRYIWKSLNRDNYLKIINTPFFVSIKNDLEEAKNINKNKAQKFMPTSKVHDTHQISNYKFVIYSGHDRNIQNFILNMFDQNYLTELYNKSATDKVAYDFLGVPYASSFIFELHEYDDEFYVKIFYNGKEIKDNLRITKNFGQHNWYEENKGFVFSYISELFDSRTEKAISDLEC